MKQAFHIFQQALHIFQKDVRCLRLEIGLFALLCGLYAWASGMGWTSTVVELAAAYLLVRAIHAEAIPGDRQFWLTRPYRPISLCGAKLLFTIVCICLPVGIAQLGVVLRWGYPLGQEIPGLLCSQLIILAVSLPVAAVAATTASIIPFVVSLLVLIIAVLIGGRGWLNLVDAHFFHIPITIDWICALFSGTIAAAAGALIVFWQYRDRRTRFSRIFGISAFVLALGSYTGFPVSWALTAETWLPPTYALTDRATVIADLGQRSAEATEIWWSRTVNPVKVMQIDVPLVLGGLPRGVEAVEDAVSVSLIWADRTWSPELNTGWVHSTRDKVLVLNTLVPVDRDLYKERREAAVTVRGSVYISLFGEPEKRTISLKNGRANAQDGLQCFSGDLTVGREYFLCQSLFRWPARLVRAEASGSVSDVAITAPSYSPFPVELGLEMISYHWGEPIHADAATVITTRPLTHFRRDFELKGIQLADFEKPVHRWSPIDPVK
jgi:hypothetical protein